MTAFEAGLTRDQAFELLNEHNKDPFHIEHGETVEQTMRSVSYTHLRAHET